MSPPRSGPQRVLVLGASSAIAAEVAALCARRGARLHLVARNAEKLARVAERCAGAGAEVSTEVADFARMEANDAVLARAWEALGGVDLALVAHGDLGDQLESERTFEEAQRILEVNLLSVVSLLVPLASRMEQARGGKLGVLTSVAGDRGRPRNYTYGTAKGALHVYLQGLRSRLYRAGVSVTAVKLGPVDTPMTTSHRKNALFGKPEAVAATLLDAVEARESEAYVPRFWRAIMAVVRHTPEAVFQRLSFLSGR